MLKLNKFGKEIDNYWSNWVKLKMSTFPKTSQAQPRNIILFAQAKLSLEIKNFFEPKSSQARILTLFLSRAEPAQLKFFGSSQLAKLCLRPTLVCVVEALLSYLHYEPV